MAAGGVDEISSDILDLSTMTWRAGPDFPEPRENGASVPFGDSFIVVGGQSGDLLTYYDDILRFDPATEDWVVMDEKIAFANDDVTAIMVPDPYC